jgi:hypothetical protein
MGVAHCPWWTTNSIRYDEYDKCCLTNTVCMQEMQVKELPHCERKSNDYYGSPLKCRKAGRVRILLVKSRRSLKYLTEKDKDYLLYAFRKISSYNCHIFEADTYAIVQSLQKRCARISVERCRADVACPFKALLPEYDIVEENNSEKQGVE